MQTALPLNKISVDELELRYLKEALTSGKICGDGPLSRSCQEWLQQNLQAHKALLTHSCTAALEAAALLLDLKPGDEVIMPSFTFVSTANAVVLRGATPVFVDVDSRTFNIDPNAVASAIGPRTRAIFPVHYAGVACDMPRLQSAAARGDGIAIVEDAAQGIGAELNGRPLGTWGCLGALSFHETKNVVAGEGGALLVNDPGLSQRAEIIREKGTDRSRFLRGEVDKYTWVDIGSSFLPSELIAAVLLAQLQKSAELLSRRLEVWASYHAAFADLEARERLRRPFIPDGCNHNGHIYYIVCRSGDQRAQLISHLKSQGITAAYHYVPLHSSPAGRKYARVAGSMANTDRAGEYLLRLPIYSDLTDVDRVIHAVREFFLLANP
jgi:dTDP-4-amino-4,6-dideoxygalactose transaminase